MNLFELVIDEEAEIYGIDAISLVEKPAIESDFVALKEQPKLYVLKDESKRIVMGPALVPDKPIFRSRDGEDFYIFFSKKTVRRAMELYFKHANQSNATLEHEQPVLDTYVVESWIKESDQDKSKQYDLDVPDGTWMVSMKIDNDAIWEEYVKTGKVKGFSIEGYFANKFELSKMTPEEKAIEEINQLCQEMLPNRVN